MISSKRFQKGFTLAEAIVAMGVLLIGILAVLQLFPAGIKLGAGSRNKTVATNIAQGKMEELYSDSYDDVASLARTKVSTVSTDQFYKFDQEVVVTTINGSLTPVATDADLKQVIVRVYWKENNKDQKVELGSIISKP